MNFLGSEDGWVGVFERFPRLYDLWAPVGWRLIGWGSLVNLYKALVEDLDSGVLVDVGCGTGTVIETLEKSFKGFVLCLDISRAMLSRAAQKSRRAFMVRASMEKLPLSRGAVDFYVSSLAIHISSSKGAVFSEMARVLKPGGVARIAVVTADTLRGRLFLRLFGLEPLLSQHYVELGTLSGLDVVKVISTGPAKIFHYVKRASLPG